MNEKMKVIICEPGKCARVDYVEDKLENLQQIVDGYIECLDIDSQACIVCNEEGKINGLSLNRAVRDENGEIFEIMAGTFFIIGQSVEDGYFKSLTDNQVEKYLEEYKYPEHFYRENGKFESIKYHPKIIEDLNIER